MVHKLDTLARERREGMRGGNGAVDFLHLEKEFLPAHGRIFSQLTLSPGSSIGKHVHTGETELFYFLAGSGVAMDDDMPVQIQAGDVMTTPSGHAHSVENTGDVDLVLIAVIITD